MSWIARIEPESAPPELRPVYDRIRAKAASQRVSFVWQAWGSHPAGLEAAFEAYRALMDEPSPLSRAQAEMIALVVSATNGCGYCVSHHGPRLARLVGEEIARDVARDFRSANLAARDRVLLDLAIALTCEPSERGAADLERLREYGFDDAGIVRAVEIAGYYAWINRVVLALGVELEPGLEAWAFGSPA
ncbi:MAG TPA: peroxidase-related enzyme [Candidatus Acidoferrales bacterium]|nr:peroxidase-related enzyme [Candidatus Acidoferrales bacterium]